MIAVVREFAVGRNNLCKPGLSETHDKEVNHLERQQRKQPSTDTPSCTMIKTLLPIPPLFLSSSTDGRLHTGAHIPVNQ